MKVMILVIKSLLSWFCRRKYIIRYITYIYQVFQNFFLTSKVSLGVILTNIFYVRLISSTNSELIKKTEEKFQKCFQKCFSCFTFSIRIWKAFFFLRVLKGFVFSGIFDWPKVKYRKELLQSWTILATHCGLYLHAMPLLEENMLFLY